MTGLINLDFVFYPTTKEWKRSPLPCKVEGIVTHSVAVLILPLICGFSPHNLRGDTMKYSKLKRLIGQRTAVMSNGDWVGVRQ